MKLLVKSFAISITLLLATACSQIEKSVSPLGPSAGVPSNATCVSSVKDIAIVGGHATYTVTGSHALTLSLVSYRVVGPGLYPQEQFGGVGDVYEAGRHSQSVGLPEGEHRVYLLCGDYMRGEDLTADTFGQISTRILAIGR